MLAVKCCELTSVTTTLLIGSFLSGSGLILTSIVNDFNALYFVYGVMFGLGSSFVYTPCLIMIGKWFHKYQAVTTGAACASAPFGAVVLSPLIQMMIKTVDLRKTIRYCGIAYLITTIICSLCFKPLSDIMKNDKEKDEKTLLSCCSDIKKEQKRKITPLHKNKPYLVFLLAMMVTNFSYYVPIIHLVSLRLFIILL